MNKIFFFIFVGMYFFVSSAQLASAQSVSFQEQVLPILKNKCGECHGDENPEVRLTVINYEELMEGSEFGIVISPGDPSSSYMIELIALGEMPQDGEPVTNEELSLIEVWIEEGALDN